MNTPDGFPNPDLEAVIAAELGPGEKVVWAGQPIPARYARQGIGAFVFGVPWTAFALFWTAGASGFKLPDLSGPAGLFPLFGIPFILVGIALLLSPYYLLRKAARTAYFITDRRAVAVEMGLRGVLTFRSFEPGRLTSLSRRQHPDGSGDLLFTSASSAGEGGDGSAVVAGFFGVPDVKRVEEHVRRLKESSRS